MDEIETVVKGFLKIFVPDTATEKVMAVVDSFGIICSVMLYGLGWRDKEIFDGLLSTAILGLTVLSISATIIIKVDTWLRNRKKG